MTCLKQRRFKPFAWVAPVLVASAEAMAADEWLDLGTLNGGSYSRAWGISADGSVVVGDSGDGLLGDTVSAFRWTAAGGMVNLGRINGGSEAIVGGLNAVGDVVVGTARDGAAADANRAYRWTQGTGMVSLGTLNGGFMSDANGVNAVGNVVVGMSSDGAAGNESRAYRWTQATGMVNLGTFNNGAFSSAQGINAAGDVVVGYSADGNLANASRAFRWTQGTGLIDLGTLNGGGASFAFATNAAGNVVVGRSEDGSVGGFDRAFRWTQATGMVGLGTLHGGFYSEALGVDGSGNVVVGRSFDGSQGADRAFRWTQASGMQSIEEWLAAAGVSVAGLATGVAEATNADGSVVVGTLANNHAFLARVSALGSGVVTPGALGESITRVSGSAPTLVLNDGEMVMDGNPMLNLLPNCNHTAWVAGDLGRYDTGQYDSDLGLAEIGIGTRLCTGMQFNVALGHIYSEADTGYGGETTLRSTYVRPEIIHQWGDSSLHTTLTGLYAVGDADIDRSYPDPAGNVMTSHGSSSTHTAGARVRFDWHNAFKTGVTNLTPYMSLTYLKTHVSGYTETGGGFPAEWSRRSDHATTAHVGIDAAHPLNEKTNLLGRIEAAHRFENDASDTQVEIIGLSSLPVKGQSIRQNWLRLGAGVQSRIFDGIASLMFNVTTRGEVPTYWLNASYRWAF